MAEMDYSKYFPVLEYYRKFVIPLNSKRFYIKSDRMMVCPLHDDHDPSLGVVRSGKDGELVHCFGCNFWGNIVELHIRVCKRHLKRYLTEDEAIRDLCRIFSIKYDSLPKEVVKTDLDRDIQQELAIQDAMERFDIQDFRVMFMEGKKAKKSLAYFNTLMMVMINEIKSSD